MAKLSRAELGLPEKTKDKPLDQQSLDARMKRIEDLFAQLGNAVPEMIADALKQELKDLKDLVGKKTKPAPVEFEVLEWTPSGDIKRVAARAMRLN